MDEIEGIVLSTTDYKESSKIVNLYTELGKIGVRANGSKNIKKGLLGFITTGNRVLFLRSSSSLPSLLEYSLVSSVFDYASDFNKVHALSVIIEIVSMIPEDSDHKRIYPFIVKTIEDLDKYNPNKVLALFLIKMLYVFGVNPNLKSCVVCGNTDVRFISISNGGALCDTHRNDNSRLDIWNNYYYLKDINEIPNTDFKVLLDEVNLYYKLHVHYNIKNM